MFKSVCSFNIKKSFSLTTSFARYFSETPSSNIFTGTVKWYNAQRGFGFITGKDGQDYFVYHHGIKREGFRSLRNGEDVEFTVNTSNDKKMAENVTGPNGKQPLGAERPQQSLRESRGPRVHNDDYSERKRPSYPKKYESRGESSGEFRGERRSRDREYKPKYDNDRE